MINKQCENNDILLNLISNTQWYNFELTNFCNIPCNYCANKHLKRKGYMSLQDFQTIVDKLFYYKPFSKEVLFCGYGEPFLNKSIYDMIDYIDDLGIKLTIQSNGKWQLNDGRINSLYKVYRLSVTIDGVTNEVYNLSRPNTDVNSVFDNLKKIVEFRQRDGKMHPIITAKMNVFAFNKHETHDFINKCRDLNFDQICLAKGYGPPDVITTIDRAEYERYSDIELSIDETLFENKINCCGGKSEIKEDIREIAKLIRQNPSDLFLTLGCFNTATIKWDGTLLPCCWDVYSTLHLGNLVNSSVEEVLSRRNLDKKGREILDSMNDCFTKVPCVNCPYCLQWFQPGIPIKIRKLLKNLLPSKLRSLSKKVLGRKNFRDEAYQAFDDPPSRTRLTKP